MAIGSLESGRGSKVSVHPGPVSRMSSRLSFFSASGVVLISFRGRTVTLRRERVPRRRTQVACLADLE